MTADNIQVYQEALRNLETATRQVERLITNVQNGAGVLQHWQQVTISNSGVSFPAEAMVHSINADEWPSAQQLAETLSKWHKVKHEVNNAWYAIPRENKTGLQPPPDD